MPSQGKSPVKYNRLTKLCVCVLRFSGLDMQSQRSHCIPTAVSISRAETMSRGERGVLSHAESAENAEFGQGRWLVPTKGMRPDHYLIRCIGSLGFRILTMPGIQSMGMEKTSIPDFPDASSASIRTTRARLPSCFVPCASKTLRILVGFAAPPDVVVTMTGKFADKIGFGALKSDSLNTFRSIAFPVLQQTPSAVQNCFRQSIPSILNPGPETDIDPVFGKENEILSETSSPPRMTSNGPAKHDEPQTEYSGCLVPLPISSIVPSLNEP